jgi:PAS domain S-box-containing protein
VTQILSIETDPEFIRLSQLPDAVRWTMALTGAITYVSESVREVRGLSPQEAMAQSGGEILTPESLAVSLGYFENLTVALQSGQAPEHFRGRFEYRCADGSTVWCKVVAGIVVLPSGDVSEIRGVSVPVTSPVEESEP